MDTHVPVVCGHSGATILPLLSQVANAKFSDADKEAITQRIQTAGDLVVKAKAGGGSATLSMAFAGAQFTNSVLRAMSGEKGIIECTFVESEVQPGVPYFSRPVERNWASTAWRRSTGLVSWMRTKHRSSKTLFRS